MAPDFKNHDYLGHECTVSAIRNFNFLVSRTTKNTVVNTYTAAGSHAFSEAYARTWAAVGAYFL